MIGSGAFIALVAVTWIMGHDLIHQVGRVASVFGVIGSGNLAVRVHGA